MRSELKRIRASLTGDIAGDGASRCVFVLAMLIVAAIAVRPPSAFADADPASDVLLAQSAFYPYKPPVAQALEVTMEKVLGAAARTGLPLKVAVIGSREDLGAIPDLFGHPQQYAEFLDKEISYNDKPPLLVVMPAGFGVVAAGPPAALAGLKIDARQGSYGLVRSAILAAVLLVRATGRRIATPSIPSDSSTGGGTPGALFAVPVLLLVVACPVILRRRALRVRRRRKPSVRSSDSSSR